MRVTRLVEIIIVDTWYKKPWTITQTQAHNKNSKMSWKYLTEYWAVKKKVNFKKKTFIFWNAWAAKTPHAKTDQEKS